MVLHTFKDLLGRITATSISPDNKMLASATRDSLKLWDVASGTVLHTLGIHSHSCDIVVFSPDGKLLASASFGMVRLWDVSSGALLQTRSGYSSWAYDMAF